MSDDSRSRAGAADARPKHTMIVANWAAALSTALGAAAVVVFAYVQVLGTAGCSDRACPRVGPGEFGFTVMTYGAPIVAAMAILLSFVTARKPWAPVVPVVAWLLLIAAFVVLVVTFP
ncbi:MAG: hypothetical protein WCE30_10320 [Mycobacterium sp.]